MVPDRELCLWSQKLRDATWPGFEYQLYYVPVVLY